MEQKPFRTFEEQIAILKSRNLSFVNEDAAVDILSTYSYYEIINGYKEVGIARGENYRDGVTFEQLFNLFLMDKKIRSAIAIAINEIEAHLRTALSYTVAKHYSADQNEYLKRRYYEKGNTKKRQSQRTQLLNKCNKILNDSSQPYKHYREHHGNIPPWILVKGMTFGNLITFYKLQMPSIKTEVISLMTKIPEELVTDDLKDMMVNILYFLLAHRNNSAHVSRAYNFKTEKSKIRYTKAFHDRMKISKMEYDNGNGQNGLSTLAFALSWFQTHNSPVASFSFAVTQAIDEYLKLYPSDKGFIEKEIEGPFYIFV
ncbi:Abi family protein [Streptococcus dysgalactiae]|uniref:Abi family protein n=1 Tax=Streptococcus dysgalactiae TaxID=1334 RepID=A0AAE9ULT4_STRDY|nr:Abi family protein [Streptococcus dysgalactiae]WAI92972.1 Abi family protein [Streptococcus dysgalactiae]WCE85232.1 Abi family protein [Streptococcus dysgalactiae]WCN25232.1 Abi family protein [Streptococcus dysgalactiae]BBE41247.1 Abi-like protein [Streptococcus dysgalactiae]